MRFRSLTSAALLVTCVLMTAPAAQEPRALPRDIRLEGHLTDDDYERLFERTFDVPPGTTRVVVDLDYTGKNERTVLDLGLRGARGLRGWSGGGRSHVEISALTATPGYLPGPIEPGRWAVIVGVPNIRKGRADRYTLSIHLLADEASRTQVIKAGAGWFAGDLHTHSMHSDGRARAWSGAQTPAPPYRVFEAAARAGLAFVNLSDHNTVSHWLDVDRLQPYFDQTLLLHGRELTTYRGHATVVGERAFNEFRLANPFASPAELLAPLASGGAFVSINHPTSPDDETCMGCGWNVSDANVMAHVHGVEVVNGDWRTSGLAGWSFWSDLLNRGFHLTAVGGSDDHAVDDPADRSIGVPATMVYASELSEPAIVAGLKSGRVYIRTRGVAGPSLEFWAEHAGRRTEMGETLRAADGQPILLHAEIGGGSQQTVEWVRNGSVDAREPTAAGSLMHRVEARAGSWVSLRVRDGEDVTLISNAIYLAAENRR